MTAKLDVTPAGRAQLASLAAEPFSRLWDRVVGLVEMRGLELGDSKVSISAPSEAERVAIGGLLGRPLGSGAALRVRLVDLDAALRRGPLRAGLLEVLGLLGRSVRDRVAEETALRRSIEDVLDRARGSRLGSENWFTRWLDGLVSDGTVHKHVVEGTSSMIGSATALFELLPAESLPLAVLAARITGTTKGLEPGEFSTLVLRGLALRAGVAKPTRAAERRGLWESFGIVVDDLSSNVLVLNLPAVGRSRLDQWLDGAATDGTPLRLTLHQLAIYHLHVRPTHVWLCENPAVVRAAAQRFGSACAPIVCSEGQPSTAFDVLLDALARHGCEFAYHGDFDWPGIRIATGIRARHGAALWRMSAGDYRGAITGLDASQLPELEGEPVLTPWDPSLGQVMVDVGRAVFEESVVDLLLDDVSMQRIPAPSGRARASVGELIALSRCSHRVHLDRVGDASRRLPASPFLEMLWGDSGRGEEAATAGREVTRVDPDAPADVRRRHTLDLMHAGTPLIAGAYLDIGDLVGRVPLLERIEQKSTLGAFAYQPTIVRRASSEESELDARDAFALCAFAEMLEHVQDWRPHSGIVAARDGTERRVDLEAFRPRYRELRRSMRRVLLDVATTRPGLKSECGMCHWQTYCRDALIAADDVTLIPSIGESERERLETLDVKSRVELADVAPRTLEEAGFGKRRTQHLIRAARVHRLGVPEVLAAWKRPVVDVEIVYDIEDAVFDPFVYLHGLLMCGASDSEVAQVCARLPETEHEVWSRFVEQIRTIDTLGTYCVYVYGQHERSTLRRLMRQYGSVEIVETFLARFVDVHELVKSCMVLPVESYGLKTVAHHAGFGWRDAKADGAQSMVWWADYVRDPIGCARARERILAYNEDDLRATRVVVGWLERITAQGP